MDKSGNSERRTKAHQERVSLRVARNLQEVIRAGDITLNEVYPDAMRALEEIRGHRQPANPSANLSEAVQSFFRPQLHSNMANHLATASQSIGQPRFETTVPAQTPAAQPESTVQIQAPVAQPETYVVDPALQADPFAYFENQFAGQAEAPVDYPVVASVAATSEQVPYTHQLDADLDAGTVGGRAHVVGAIDLHQDDSAAAGYLDNGQDAARQMVEAAYTQAENQGSNDQLERVG